MTKKQMRTFKRLITCLLCIILLTPVEIYAATPDMLEPQASNYLVGYSTYICPIGEYDIQIWWNVISADARADIGVLTIMLYESTDNINWTWVKTYRHTTYTQMLDHDTGRSMDYVFYDGDHSCYYKAYVTIYAGDETGGDTRYKWTGVEQGTP